MKKEALKEFRKPEVAAVAKEVLKRGPVCDNCLGRQAAQVSTGMTNRDRGKALRQMLGAGREPAKCGVCMGIFKRIDGYADAAAKRLAKLEYETFLVGTKMSCDFIRSEESLWEDVGIDYCESIRSELNRELGKLIWKKVKHEVDEKSPDVLVILNLEKDRIDLQVKSLFISGGYKKLVRGIPQTKWDKYRETVEDIIAAPLLKATGGEGHSMHAAGREDIDARCLDWRPFVFEIKNPVRRKIDLRLMRAKIKKSGKVEVSGLSFSDKKQVPIVKSMRHDKTYSVLVEFERPVKSIEAVEGVKGYVSQRTPTRVMHRRADLTRKRRVIDISWKRINNKNFELQIKGEAGLYVKELVTGDSGRTKPSIAGLLGNPAAVKALDVIKIWD
ncbi:MAG: tRNA pseudouridine(54/55) synthase Pus10 [Candidatus Aenigmarchaeota archaeon]|nr:tRNA pseudouridine(54/55) synthase Pus10 [Candidatus Aenigmarchaeota archaeon]